MKYSYKEQECRYNLVCLALKDAIKTRSIIKQEASKYGLLQPKSTLSKDLKDADKNIEKYEVFAKYCLDELSRSILEDMGEDLYKKYKVKN